jgi:hypothetical protein
MSEDDVLDPRWVSGHDAGYTKGRDDGISIGYMDAKLRAYLALDAIEEAGVLTRSQLGQLQQALETLVGKRS